MEGILIVGESGSLCVVGLSCRFGNGLVYLLVIILSHSCFMAYKVKVKDFFYQLSTSLISSDKKKVKWANMPLMCVENYYKLV